MKKLVFVCGFNNYLGIDEDYDAVNESMYFDNLSDVKNYCDDIDFHNFLIEKLPNDYKYDDNFQKISDKLTDLNNMVFRFVNTDEEIDFKELNTESEKELHVIFNIG